MSSQATDCAPDCRWVAPRLQSDEWTSRPTATGETSLWLEQAPGRLRVLAIALGVFSAIGLVLNLIGPALFGWYSDCARIGAATEAGFIALTLGFLALIKSDRFQASTLVHLGLAYVIVKAFGISFMEQSQPLAGVSFVSVLIVLFPLFVPTSLGKMMLAAYGAALTGPLAAWMYTMYTGRQPMGGDQLWTAHFINFAVATLAVVPAWMMHRVGRDMRRARQMGSYELSRLIGRGGMGEVWRARHRMLHRPAAIKLIQPQALGAATPDRARQLWRRFEREAQATAALHSQHTIEVYDFGVTDEGEFFYVMELLDGFDMETLVERFGPISPARAVELLLQVCDSLEDAHLSGLIHRDIKPANIYVCRYGHKVDFVKVLDFGLVKSTDDEGQTKLTADGAAAGTPACMAPEMALGDQEIDHRADLYALGCVAYWLLTGSMVFEADSNLKMVLKHIQDPPEPPSLRSEVDIPRALDDVVLWCLAKAPSDRPQSARELADRLRALNLEEVWSEDRAERWWQAHKPAMTPQTSLEPTLPDPVREQLQPQPA